MLAPDSQDIFDKLRHSVAVSGSGLPIHKGDETLPEEPPPPPMPYEEDGVFDISALQSSLKQTIQQQEAVARAEATAEAARAQQPKQPPKPSAAASILAHPVLNPVMPRDYSDYHAFDDEEPQNRMGTMALIAVLAGVALLIGGGAIVAKKTGWMSLGAVHIKAGQGKGTDGQGQSNGQGIRKILVPAPPGGPTQEDIQSAADAAINGHYAAIGTAGDLRAALSSLRIIARQPTDNPSSWQVLMTITTYQLPKTAPNRAPEIKEGYPEKGQSTVLELPRNAGAEGAPPAAPFISAPLPPQKPEMGKMADDANPKKGPPSAPTEPQPRWVNVNWSGERWFIGDYEFD